MPRSPDQILTVAQMQAAELEIGASVDDLMQIAGRGAADYVWRVAAHRRVTVLCGPGNNGGDGYVIAQALRERGGAVSVVAAAEPGTAAARKARSLFGGEVLEPDADPAGDIFVDCLFGSGLKRPLGGETLESFARLAASHRQRIAIDVPSGVEADSGALLNEGLPSFDLTIALGAWKFAHFLMPATATMGALKLVEIGCDEISDAARVVSRPRIAAPAADAHKYRRGLLGLVCGEMPGAALLAALSAQGGGAGYVKLLGAAGMALPPDLVASPDPLPKALDDRRLTCLLVGPGLGRGDVARQRLTQVLAAERATVLDADGLLLLEPHQLAHRGAPLVLTPHEGELQALECNFGLSDQGSKVERARDLSRATKAIVVAKGPDTVIAGPDGRTALAPRASSWLSVAGTGDVLAGVIASRLATGADPFDAACEGVWLHGEAAQMCGAAFTASKLARTIPSALAACL